MSLTRKKIRKNQRALSSEQLKYAKQFARNWISYQLSSKSVDDTRLEELIGKAYEVAGKKRPKKILYFDSPIAALKHRDSVGDSVWASVGDSVGDSVWASVWDSVGDSVWASVWDSVWDSVRASVWDSVWDSVRASVWDSVGDSVWASVWASVRAYSFSGAGAFYKFFDEEFQKNDLCWLAEFNLNTSGYFLYENEVWIVRKPTKLTRDKRGRLHNETGKCMEYRDGWGFYAIHGVRVPEKAVLSPEKLTKKEILEEPNQEVRRVMIERLGSDRFAKIVKPKLLHKDMNGELVQAEIQNDEPWVAVKVKDSSTDRTYYLRVPPSTKTATAAVAWTFGLKEPEYRVEKET